jgi:hypothetical protein
MDIKDYYQVKISYRLEALENDDDDDDDDVDINRVWESIRENIQASATEILGYHNFKQQKQWFDERCSKLLDQRKET